MRMLIHPAMGWFGLGWYAQIAVLSWLGLALQNPTLVLFHIIVFALMFWLLKRTQPQAP